MCVCVCFLHILCNVIIIIAALFYAFDCCICPADCYWFRDHFSAPQPTHSRPCPQTASLPQTRTRTRPERTSPEPTNHLSSSYIVQSRSSCVAEPSYTSSYHRGLSVQRSSADVFQEQWTLRSRRTVQNE